MALSFSTVEIPVQTRTTNEFVDVVKNLKVGDKALAFTVPSATPKEQKNIRVINRQLSEAGAENGVTVRRTIKTPAGKNVDVNDASTFGSEAVVTFWTVAKIVHENKVDKEVADHPVKPPVAPAKRAK